MEISNQILPKPCPHKFAVVMMSVKPSIVATDLGKVRVRAHVKATGCLSESVNNIVGVMQKQVSGMGLATVTNTRISYKR